MEEEEELEEDESVDSEELGEVGEVRPGGVESTGVAEAETEGGRSGEETEAEEFRFLEALDLLIMTIVGVISIPR